MVGLRCVLSVHTLHHKHLRLHAIATAYGAPDVAGKDHHPADVAAGDVRGQALTRFRKHPTRFNRGAKVAHYIEQTASTSRAA